MAYSDEVLADSPHFYWRLDETVGTNADDATANNRDGTYTNSPALNEASLLASYPEGRSIDVGGSAHVASTFLLNSSNITIEVWVSIDVLPATGALAVVVGFGDGWASSTHDKELFIDENAKPGLRVFDGGTKITSVPADALSLSTPYHLAGTSDGSNARIYVNGIEVGSVAASGSFAGFSVNNVFAPFLPSGAGTWETFQGRIDELAVYTTALSAERLLAHHAASILSPPSPTLRTVVSTLSW